MTEKHSPERNESGEENQAPSKGEAFRKLTERLLEVSPEELRQKEYEWKKAKELGRPKT
jgi:hypothetical protein